MESITLKQLRYFDVLSRQLHFGRASEICGISQPALSMQIKELEQTLNTALFERRARSIRLSMFGEDFAAKVKDVLAAVAELEKLAHAHSEKLTGRLRMGVIPTIAPYLLPKLISQISRDLPDLDLHIRETITPRLIAELDEGKIDTAIVALPISEPSLTEVAIFQEDFVFVRHAQDAHRPVPDPDQLSKMRLLLLEEGHCFRDQALSFCNLNTSIPRDGLDGSSLSTLVQLVGSGLGVTVIPEMAVPVETAGAAVSVSQFDTPKPFRKIGMIWRKTSPLADHFADLSVVVRKASVLMTPANIKS